MGYREWGIVLGKPCKYSITGCKCQSYLHSSHAAKNAVLNVWPGVFRNQASVHSLTHASKIVLLAAKGTSTDVLFLQTKCQKLFDMLKRAFLRYTALSCFPQGEDTVYLDKIWVKLIKNLDND